MEASGSKRSFVLTRRAFMKAAVAAGGAIALPLTGASRQVLNQLALSSATTSGPVPLGGGPFFLSRSYSPSGSSASYDLWGTAAALCDRIVPADPVFGPGAAAAGAVNYIDLFMGAFQENVLSLVSGPPIWLSGPFSGRWPFGDEATGKPSSTYPTDSFEKSNGQIQFLGLTPLQAMVWYLRIYGTAPPSTPSWVSKTWLSQVASTAGATGSPPTVPGAQNLRSLYEQGLVAFDQWSEQNFGTPFASDSSAEQDALVLLASNPVLGAASENGLPGLPSPLPNPVPPAAAASLFGVMVLHTIQGTYGLPEYEGLSDKASGGQVTWASIGYDGDTQPLGSSIYDEYLDTNEPEEPDNFYTNDGFGFPAGGDNPKGAFTPVGAYVEYRPVSHPDPGSSLTQSTLSEFEALIAALKKAGANVVDMTGA